MCCIKFNCGFDVLFRRRMGSGELLMNLIDQALRETELFAWLFIRPVSVPERQQSLAPFLAD